MGTDAESGPHGVWSLSDNSPKITCWSWTFLVLATRTRSKILDWWILTLHIVSHCIEEVEPKDGKQSFLRCTIICYRGNKLTKSLSTAWCLASFTDCPKITWFVNIRRFCIDRFKNHLFYLWWIWTWLLAVFAVLVLCNRISIFEI